MYATKPAPQSWTLLHIQYLTRKPPFRDIAKEHHRYRYDSVEEMAKLLIQARWHPCRIAEMIEGKSFVIIDPDGNVSDGNLLLNAVRAICSAKRRHRQGRARKPYCGHRYPRTTGEIRANEGFLADDYDGCERKHIKARIRELYHAWDDIIVCRRGKSWKNFRRTKYFRRRRQEQ